MNYSFLQDKSAYGDEGYENVGYTPPISAEPEEVW